VEQRRVCIGSKPADPDDDGSAHLPDGERRTFDGATPTSILERTGITFDKPDVVKTLRQVIPRIDATAGTVLSIQLGASMDAEVAPTWQPAVSYTVGTTRKAGCDRDGAVPGVSDHRDDLESLAAS
jgi:hypothetical protein